MQKKDCLFCGIQRKEIPGHIFYEDDVCYAMMDLYPAEPGHVLIIPNEHFDNYMETDPKVLGHLVTVAQKIAAAQERAFGSEGNKLVINCKEVGNQKIFHTHVHILPFYTNKPPKESLEVQMNKLKVEMNK